MQSAPLIYSLVSRGHETILSSFSMHAGNFPSIALDVLKKCNLSKTFGQYATQNYCFYTFVKDGFVFLVMVEARVHFTLIFSTKPESLSASSKKFKINFSEIMMWEEGVQQWPTPSNNLTGYCR